MSRPPQHEQRPWQSDDDWIFAGGRAPAFYEPGTQSIGRIRKNDVVFLYANQVGIVGYGYGAGKARSLDHRREPDARHCQVLDSSSGWRSPFRGGEDHRGRRGLLPNYGAISSVRKIDRSGGQAQRSKRSVMLIL